MKKLSKSGYFHEGKYGICILNSCIFIVNIKPKMEKKTGFEAGKKCTFKTIIL